MNNAISEQYKDSSNISKRIQFHERFSTNKLGFHEWAFEQMKLTHNMNILECGCGPAAIWYKNINKIASPINITLMDLSEGMLNDARKNVASRSDEFNFKVGDIQELPFEDESFDVVIANHMLYHVSDIPKAIREVRRVLKKGGLFFASTFSKLHLKEMDELIRQFIVLPDTRTSDKFTLENGFDYINNIFQNTALLHHDDALIVTESQPLIDYVLSSSKARKAFDEEKLHAFINKIDFLLERDKSIVITKRAGLFVSSKPL
ncbi:class I SAM-dependent methyltransferase [Paenibacillus sp. ClWae2A]|uniref:class I SAM-dependent methyltransferase n=1 Tax=Paenibacillus sp. ClWae2A TaxID=3057177 RepID=UPI0028F5D5EA|nr:class I SAM-dependent methyltransferase [Paenibacillus sp. ClWae2A]MDT9722445.1 class I SAM-dependent methyltransferase [Paenibacillus sp. ClWae2A]